MTAVGLQPQPQPQPHRSAPQSSSSNVSSRPSTSQFPQAHAQPVRPEPRSSPQTSHRPALSNEPVNGGGGGGGGGSRHPALDNARKQAASITNGASQRRASLQSRPIYAPNGAAESLEVPDAAAPAPAAAGVASTVTAASKPLLVRAKSDVGPLQNLEREEVVEEDISGFGARHGFDDHYASEEYVSQLANVSRPFPLHVQLLESLQVTAAL